MARLPKDLENEIKDIVSGLSKELVGKGRRITLEVNLFRYRLKEPVRIHPKGPFAFYNLPDGSHIDVEGDRVYLTYTQTEKEFNGSQIFEPEIDFHPDNYTPHRIRLAEGSYHRRESGLQMPEEERVSPKKKQRTKLPLDPNSFPIGGDFELD